MSDNHQNRIYSLKNKLYKSLSIEKIRDLLQYWNFSKDQYAELVNYIEKLAFPILESYISGVNEINESYMDISEAQNSLNYKDVRSVILWCQKNSVFVIQQGNRQLVSKAEFLLAFHKPFIEHLKKNHKNWKEIFDGFLKGNLTTILNSTPEIKVVTHSYQPKSESEKSFLKNLKNL